MGSAGGAGGQAINVAMLFDVVNRSNADLRQAYDSTHVGWACTPELRDIETEAPLNA